MTQFIFENLNFDEPFILTYIGTSLFILYLPGWFLVSICGLVDNPPCRRSPQTEVLHECCDTSYELVGLLNDVGADNESPSDSSPGGPETASPLQGSPTHPLREPIMGPSPDSPRSTCDKTTEPGLADFHDASPHYPLASAVPELQRSKPSVMSHIATARVSLVVCPIWFIANWSYNQSLSMTSVTSSTIISTTSALFAFVFSVIFAGERYSLVKLLGVSCCMGGTVMVALSDASGGNGDDDDGAEVKHGLAGDLLALFSALAYSCYTVVIKKFVPDDDGVAMPLLFGYLGLLNCLILAPVVILATVLTRGAIFNNMNGEVRQQAVVPTMYTHHRLMLLTHYCRRVPRRPRLVIAMRCLLYEIWGVTP